MTATMITTPEQINLYRLRVLRSGLKLELKGMRHSTNAIFKSAKQITGQKTRQKCYDVLNDMIESQINL